MFKVAFIFALSGTCTCNEIHGMMSNDVKFDGPSITFKIENPKYGIEKKFVITSEPYFNIVKTYMGSRPLDLGESKFFLEYRNEKCTKKPIGKLKMHRLPETVSEYLNIPNADTYSWKSLRKSSHVIKMYKYCI